MATKKLLEAAREYLAEIGRRGGLKRAKTLSAKRRRQIAAIAGKAPRRKRAA